MSINKISLSAGKLLWLLSMDMHYALAIYVDMTYFPKDWISFNIFAVNLNHHVTWFTMTLMFDDWLHNKIKAEPNKSVRHLSFDCRTLLLRQTRSLILRMTTLKYRLFRPQHKARKESLRNAENKNNNKI